MSTIYVCDGCGKQEAGGRLTGTKPPSWFQRQDEDGVQHACSRECIAKTAAATGKTGLALPL